MGSGAWGNKEVGIFHPIRRWDRAGPEAGQDKTRQDDGRYVRAVEALRTARALVLAGILVGSQVTGEVVGALIDAFADLTDVVGGRGRGRGWSRLGLWPFGTGRSRCLLLLLLVQVTVERSRVGERTRARGSRDGSGGNNGDRRWVGGGRNTGSVVVVVGVGTSALSSHIPGARRGG